MTYLKPLCVGLACLFSAVAMWDQALAQLPTQELVSIARRETKLHRIDRETGKTLSILSIRLPEGVECANFRGGNGLATNPLTEELYALLSCGEDATRLLAIIDTFTGAAAVVGDTGDFFSGLAFSPDGTLVGITGNRGATPNTLFRISIVDANATAICQLPGAPQLFGQGQAIAINPAGVLFEASGNPNQGGIQTFGSIADLTPTDPLVECNRTDIPLSGDAFVQPGGMTFGGSFLFVDLLNSQGGRLFRLTESGEATLLGNLDHVSKGLAFVSGPAKICYKVAKAEGKPGKRGVVIEDLIVGERPARPRTLR